MKLKQCETIATESLSLEANASFQIVKGRRGRPKKVAVEVQKVVGKAGVQEDEVDQVAGEDPICNEEANADIITEIGNMAVNLDGMAQQVKDRLGLGVWSKKPGRELFSGNKLHENGMKLSFVPMEDPC
ncbi:hypothetical protein Ancab_013022 [Ancistrocladus abbreviatus]